MELDGTCVADLFNSGAPSRKVPIAIRVTFGPVCGQWTGKGQLPQKNKKNQKTNKQNWRIRGRTVGSERWALGKE